MATANLELVIGVVDNASSGLGSIGDKLGTIGKIAGGVALGGIVAIGGALVGTAAAGLGFNNSMEQATARLNAFTGDGAKTAEILEMVRERAAKTPFAFEEMAAAAASLGPVSRSSGVDLETLIGKAEILAASNPAQGFEGAVVALKEATGGDFTSIVERFDLPRQRLKELAAEGVPAAEAVSIAMTEMGLNADLVSGMANTAVGRWSTLQDTFTTLAASITAPIFEGVSSGMGGLQAQLDANMPKIQEFATLLGEKVSQAMTWLATTAIPGLIAGWQTIQPATSAVIGFFGEVIAAWGRIGAAFQDGGIMAALGQYWTEIQGFGSRLLTWLGEQAPLIGAQVLAWGQSLIGWVAPMIPQALTALGGLATSIGAWIVAQAPAWATQVLQWGTALIGWIAPYIPIVLGKLGELATAAWNWVTTQAPILAEKLLSWGASLINWISPYIPQVLAKLGELAASAWGWITAQVPVLVAKFGEWGAALGNWVGPAIPVLLGKLGELATSAWGWVSEQAPILLAKLQAWGASMVEWIGPQIPILLGKAGELASQFIGWIGEQAAPLLAKLQTWAASFVAWVVPATTKFLQEWPGQFNRFLTWIGEQAGPLLLKLGEWALQFVAWIGPMIPKLLLAAVGISAAILTFIAETAVVLIGKLLEWGAAFVGWIAKDVIPLLVPALGGIISTIGGWITDTAVPWATSALVSIGTNLVAGIRSGISGAWEGLLGWIDGKVAMIPKAIRDFLGIGSPSKVMAEQVGQWIPAGIAAGIAGNSAVLGQAMGTLQAGLMQGWGNLTLPPIQAHALVGTRPSGAYGLPASMPHQAEPYRTATRTSGAPTTGTIVERQVVLNVSRAMNVESEFAGLDAWANAGRS